MHVKKNDTVYILSGKDKGKTGKVLRAFPKEGKVIVDGVNMRKVHVKARKQGEKGKTVEKFIPLQASKVRLAEKKLAAKK